MRTQSVAGWIACRRRSSRVRASVSNKVTLEHALLDARAEVAEDPRDPRTPPVAGDVVGDGEEVAPGGLAPPARAGRSVPSVDDASRRLSRHRSAPQVTAPAGARHACAEQLAYGAGAGRSLRRHGGGEGPSVSGFGDRASARTSYAPRGRA